MLSVVARITGYEVGDLVLQMGDAHIYNNHIEQCKELISRKPLKLPELWINPELKTLEDFENAKLEDFSLINYRHYSAITAPMAV